jgi:hypothetical protein
MAIFPLPAAITAQSSATVQAAHLASLSSGRALSEPCWAETAQAPWPTLVFPALSPLLMTSLIVWRLFRSDRVLGSKGVGEWTKRDSEGPRLWTLLKPWLLFLFASLINAVIAAGICACDAYAAGYILGPSFMLTNFIFIFILILRFRKAKRIHTAMMAHIVQVEKATVYHNGICHPGPLEEVSPAGPSLYFPLNGF